MDMSHLPEPITENVDKADGFCHKIQPTFERKELEK
jgi:hypothetical protein